MDFKPWHIVVLVLVLAVVAVLAKIVAAYKKGRFPNGRQ
jgi:hypothetical protein